VLINSFFGTTLNASFALADKVNELVFGFVKNLNQAAIPQIIKNYGVSLQDRSLFLVNKLSKWSFFLMLMPGVAILIHIDALLKLWLVEVPNYTSIFIILIFVHGLISSLESGFDSLIDATGNIRKSKFIFTLIFLSILFIIYFLLKQGYQPYFVLLIPIFAEVLFFLFQIRILERLTDFKFNIYLRETIVPSLIVLTLLLPQLILIYINSFNYIPILISILISIAMSVYAVYLGGLSADERKALINFVQKLNRKNKLNDTIS